MTTMIKYNNLKKKWSQQSIRYYMLYTYSILLCQLTMYYNNTSMY